MRRRGQSNRWWTLVIEGLAGVVVGVAIVLWPDITALALLYLIACWALVTGVLEIFVAIRLRKIISGEWLLALSGILSIALSVLLVLFPTAGALAIVILIGAYAFIFGVLFVALGLRLRSWGRLHSAPAAPVGV